MFSLDASHSPKVCSLGLLSECRPVYTQSVSPCVLTVRHHNIKVRINATGDTIVMKFLLPNAHTKLEGYILGYGSRFFSKQFIPLPENGVPFVKEFGKNVCYFPLPSLLLAWRR